MVPSVTGRQFLVFLGILSLSLFPIGPLVTLVAAIILVYFGKAALDNPPEVLVLYALSVPVVALLPPGKSLLPGLNFETIFTLGLLYAAWSSRTEDVDAGTRNPAGRPFVLLIVTLVLSAAYSHFTGSAQGHSYQRGWFQLSAGRIFPELKNIISYFVIAPVAFWLIRNETILKRTTIMIAWMVCVLSLEPIYALVSSVGVLGFPSRAMGTLFQEPNVLGGFLALQIALFLPLVTSRHVNGMERLLYAATVGVAGLGLIYSFSRGSWLAMLCGMLAFGVLRGVRAFGLLLVAGLLVALVMPQSAIDRLQSTVRDRGAWRTGEFEGSTQSRLDRWKALPGQWIDAPVAGHGFLSYGRVWGKIGTKGEARGPHSTIIKFTVEQGILGLGLYVWIIWTMVGSGFRIRSDEPDGFAADVGTGLIVAAGTLVVLDASGDRMINGPTMAFVWMIAGGAARMAYEASRESAPPSALDRSRAPRYEP